MKLYSPPSYQWWIVALSMPVVGAGLLSIMYGDAIHDRPATWLLAFPLLIVLGLAAWYLHAQYDHWAKVHFPSLSQSGKRIILNLLVNLLVMIPSVMLLFYFFDRLNIAGYRYDPGHIRWGIGTALVVNLVFETLWEVVYIIDKYKESLTEKQLLQQMSIEQEFDHLKSQVNPHFLFNCFNTLSSLISEDKERAEIFLDELSKVYRYLLNNHKDSFSTLDSEVKFIRSYLNLLKTRHGDALQVQIEIDKSYYGCLLPSLSLQLLVENAVKHNVVSKSRPLTIEIFTTPVSQLVVNNNLQKKQQKERSTRIGLNNIRSKYALMGEKGFQVVEGERNFMAILPLLRNKTAPAEKISTYENSDSRG